MNQTMKQKLNRYWRIAATGISFTLFALGSLPLGFLIIPLLQITTRDSKKKRLRAQYAISITFQLFMWIMKSLGLMNLYYEGFEKLNDDHSTIIIANHPTLIDYVAIIAKLRHCEIIVKEELFHNPFIKFVISAGGYIPNTQSAEMIDIVKKELDAGHNLLIFPEGTRTKPGQPIQLKRGTAQLAIRTGAPLRLIHINCIPLRLSKGTKWYQVPDKRSDFRLVVGERLDSTAFLQDTPYSSLAARRLTHCLTEKLQEHYEL